MEGIVQALLSIAKSLTFYKPAGTVMAFAGSTAPVGYLICDGASILRTDYPDLFTVIGTQYGSVDATHFTIPDIRGRVIVGKSTDTEFDVLGETGGEKAHLNTSAESGVPAHNHAVVCIPKTDAWAAPTGGLNYQYTAGATYANPGIAANTPANAASAHNNIQPYNTLNWIIKV